MVTGAPNVTLIPAKKRPVNGCGSVAATKVAAYCRVSTDEDNQRNSYSTQISYYSDYISSNPGWQLVGLFADEGISGTGTKKRTQFNRMKRLARQRKIDLILCKSISRFARNTVDCLDYVRELRSLGVAVVFEKENINTSSMSSEFAISLYASFAQAESESISKNITWAIERSFREGRVRYKLDQMLGYRLDENKRPYIVEDEAEIVRRIFREYAEGRTSTEIAEELTAAAAKRRNGSTSWNRSHVYQILKNEKYAGDAILQKTFTLNCITHERRKNTGQKPKYLVQDCHEPIIDRRTYDTVRLELIKRRRDAKRGQNGKGRYVTKYCMSRLLFCPYCGASYKRTTWLEKAGKIGVWRCKNRMEGIKCSRSSSYHEDRLQEAVLAAVNSMIEMTSSQDDYSAVTDPEDSFQLEAEKRIGMINKGLSELEAHRERILSGVSTNMFDEMCSELNEINRQEAEAARELEELRSELDEYKRNSLREADAKRLLKSLPPQASFNDELFGRLISRIDAVNKHEICVVFCGGYKTTQKL